MLALYRAFRKVYALRARNVRVVIYADDANWWVTFNLNVDSGNRTYSVRSASAESPSLPTAINLAYARMEPKLR